MSKQQKIGPFEVLEELGEGSFGPVYRGRHSAQGRSVAIKVCALEDTDIRQRFVQEAEAAAKLKHPNIAETLAVGTAGTLPYLAQELVVGHSLGEVIESREETPFETRINTLLNVARGLEYAHGQGIWHGDLKPNNIRRSDRELKILDFGIARLASAETRLTQKGVTVDTASYLPPEQVRGGELDHRVDIFSFGVLAFEALTYERPFRGKTLSALVYQILYKAPTDINSVWPDCPPALEPLINRCLAKEANERYGSIGEVIVALEAIRTGQESMPAVPLAPGSAPTIASDLDTTQPIAALRKKAGDPVDTKPVVARPHETVRMRQIPEDASASTTLHLPAQKDSQKTQRVKIGPDDAVPAPGLPPVGAATQRMAPPPSELDNDPQKTQRFEAIPSVAGASAPADDPKIEAVAVPKLPTPTGAKASAPHQVPTSAPHQVPASAPHQAPASAPHQTRASVGRPKPASPSPPAQTPAPVTGPPDLKSPVAPEGKTTTLEVAATAQPVVVPPSLPQTPSAKRASLPRTRERPTKPESTIASAGKKPQVAPPAATKASPPPVPEVASTKPSVPKAAVPTASVSKTPSPEVPKAKAESQISSAEPAADLMTSAHEISQLVAKGNLQEAMAQLQTIHSQQADDESGPDPAADLELIRPDAESAVPVMPPAAPPEERTLSRKAVAAPPSRHREPRRRPPIWLVIAGALVLALGVILMGWLLGRMAPEEPVAEAIPEPPKPRVETPADVPPPPMGTVSIDARPWGEVVEVSNVDGYLLELPEVVHTPLILSLEPGLYRIQVAHEAAAEPSLCEVEVTLTEPATCDLVFEESDAIDYFKKSGWWK